MQTMLRRALLFVALAFLAAQPVAALPTALMTPGLSPSAPVVISRNNQVVQNTRITVNTGVACVYNNGFSGVQYLNSICHHSWPTDAGAAGNANGRGYEGFNNATLLIKNIKFIKDFAPATGASSNENNQHIYVEGGSNVTIDNVYGVNGSSGATLRTLTTATTVQWARFDNMRGPFPKGQAVQFSDVANPILQDFFFYQDNSVAWSEDIVNAGGTTGGGAFRRGLIVGVNSPTGAGVLLEGTGAPTPVSDIDVMAWNNQGVSVEASGSGAGLGTTFTTARVRDSSLYSRGIQNSTVTSSVTITPTTNGTDEEAHSGSTVTYSTGSRTFNIGAGLTGWTAAKPVAVWSDDLTGSMLGTITSYTSGTGNLVINVTTVMTGSGSKTGAQVYESTLFSTTTAGATWIAPFTQTPGNSPIRADGNVAGQYLQGRPTAYIGTDLYLRVNLVNGASSNTSFTMRQVASSSNNGGDGGLAFGSFDPTTTGSAFVTCQYFNLAAPSNLLFDSSTVTGTNDITSVDFAPRPGITPVVPFGS